MKVTEELANVAWTPDDILNAVETEGYDRSKWDNDKALAFLEKYEGEIEDAMLQAGWAAIYTLLREEPSIL